MRAYELLEAKNVYNLTSRNKLWVNPEKKQIVEVPIDKHHTQYAYEKPQKFGLSGNIFRDHKYPLNDRNQPYQYDDKVAAVMFDNGWVRVNVETIHNVGLHCIDLKQCAKALRLLKQKYHALDTAIVDIGPDLLNDEHYVLKTDENGKGSFRTFMRTGKIAIKEQRMPRTLFHVSKRKNRKNILSKGLEPRNQEFTNIKREPGIYMFEDPKHAEDWAFWFAYDEKMPVDILEIHLPDNYTLKPDTHREMIDIYDAVIGKEPISPEYISLFGVQDVPKSAKEAPPFIERH